MSSFVISDTHFGHESCWSKFKLPNGDPMRPFSSTEEMDEAMVENWNRVVHPKDTVYHLGDVTIAPRHLETVKRLNGKKRLIRGNHDIHKDNKYREAGFEKIYGVRVFVDKWIFSHIPLHPDCVSERFRVNVHGHLHSNRVMQDLFVKDEVIRVMDPRYFSVCVERINYTPISFDELELAIQKQWEDLNYQPNKGWFNGSGPG